MLTWSISDACQKLENWFEDRWTDRWCIDISKELVEIIEQSWAREERIPPYYIYIKMAYHLSQRSPRGFGMNFGFHVILRISCLNFKPQQLKSQRIT